MLLYSGFFALRKVSGIPEGGLDLAQKLTFVFISAFLVLLAGLVSGLTIGLLSIDKLQMEVLQRSGTENERRLAKKIKPIISNTHFLLVTLLITNASCMEALPIFLDRLVDPVGAVIISVTLVLIFGEILPQAICSKYGLQVGASTSWLVRILMVITGIISWPVGKLLDYIFGENDLGQYRRPNLEALISLQQKIEGLGGELTDFEAQVMKGALRLSTKVASKAMTPLKYTFMLSRDDPINDETLSRILQQGHSRIPVYNGTDKNDIVGVIIVKELIRIRPDCKKIGDLNLRPVPRLPYNFPMYDILRLFSTGRSHMALLIRVKRSTIDKSDIQNSVEVMNPEEVVLYEEQKADTDLLHFWQTYMEESVDENGDHVDRHGSSPRSHSNKSNSVEEKEKSMFSLNPFSHASQGHLENSRKQQELQSKKLKEHKAHDDNKWRQYLGEDTEPVGVITIEDVIEELLGEEIVDETDQFQDNLKQNKVDVQQITSRLPQNLQYMLKYSSRVPHSKKIMSTGRNDTSFGREKVATQADGKKRSQSLAGPRQNSGPETPRVNVQIDLNDGLSNLPYNDDSGQKQTSPNVTIQQRAHSAITKSFKSVLGYSSNNNSQRSDEGQPLISGSEDSPAKQV